MSLIIPANTLASGGFNVANSVRMETNTYFTGSDKVTATSNKIGSFSFWIKRSGLGANAGGIIKVYGDANTGTYIGFKDDNTFFVEETNAGGTAIVNLITNAVYRDMSAWYHILVTFKTDDGTDSNRVKLYINGTQPSLGTATYPSQDTNLLILGSANPKHELGINADGASGKYYLAQLLHVDGTALSNTDVGEFDEDSGIWKPIDISGTTLGNNGYYLSMEDSSNFGVATGKAFTANNLAATDQSTDTCTNNFSTMNPLANKVTSVTFSEGNLKIDFANGRGGSTSTFGLTTGKWYVEYNITTMPVDERFHFGIVPREIQDADDIINTNNQGTAISGYNAAIYADSGSGSAILNNFFGNNTTRFDSFTGIIGMALDLTSSTKTIAFSKAGAWVTGGGTSDTDFSNALKVDISTAFARHSVWHIACGTGNSTGTSGVFSMNFGSPAFAISSGNTDGNGYGNFEYAVPSGYFSLNTKNLAEYG